LASARHTRRGVGTIFGGSDVPRINIEERAFTDPRIECLSHELGHDALGPLARVWHQCSNRRSDILSRTELDGSARVTGFCDRLVETELAEKLSDGTYRVKGASEAIRWLLNKSIAGKVGAHARWHRDGNVTATNHAAAMRLPCNNDSSRMASDSRTMASDSDSGSGSKSKDPVAKAPGSSAKERKAPKKYHPAEAYPSGSPARVTLLASFPELAADFDGLLAMFDVEFRRLCPGGRPFVGLDNWIRTRLSLAVRQQAEGWGKRGGRPEQKTKVLPGVEEILAKREETHDDEPAF